MPSPQPGPSGNVIYSGSGQGTYYYDIKTPCPQDPAGYAETNGDPLCTSNNPAFWKTIRQYGTNNIIAMDSSLIGSNRAKYCGKQVVVKRNGVCVAAPDGGDFFIWDGCDACVGGVRLDFSVSGARAVDSNACIKGVIPGVSWEVTDKQVVAFVP
jgi:hypothetical protein